MHEKEGFFENLDCHNLSGWAWEQTQSDSIKVDIYEVLGPPHAIAPSLYANRRRRSGQPVTTGPCGPYTKALASMG